MKNKFTFPANIVVISMAIMLFSSCNDVQQQTMDTADTKTHEMIMEEINEANNQLYAGLNAMFTGDLELLNDLWSHTENITYMGPFGGSLKGWDQISEEFKNAAAMNLGGKIMCEDLHIFAGTDVAYTTCVEVGVNIAPDGTPISVSHRATNIFHLENGKWRLVHHHTDISPQLEKAFEMETNE